MPRIVVDDPADPRLEAFLGLRDQEARKLREQPGGDMAGVFIAEGDLVIERALTNGYTPHAVLIAERRTKPLPDSLPESVDVFAASDRVLTEVSGRPKLRDPIAVFTRPPLPELADVLANGRRFAVLEGINNPNNLGVIARNAAGLGIDALLLDPTCGDPLYRRAIRSSMGQIFAIPHVRLGPLPEALGMLHERDVQTIALTPKAEGTMRDLEIGGPVAVLLGAEGPGLTDATSAAATHRARIKMAANVDSLNVASAAAIAFHAIV